MSLFEIDKQLKKYGLKKAQRETIADMIREFCLAREATRFDYTPQHGKGRVGA